jgi:hypothetical protein
LTAPRTIGFDPGALSGANLVSASFENACLLVEPPLVIEAHVRAGRGHDQEGPRRWPSAKAQISEPNPYRARNRQPQIIDDGMQPKPAIFALSRACIARGTGSSNPFPSSGESTNFRFLSTRRLLFDRMISLPPRDGDKRISARLPSPLKSVAPVLADWPNRSVFPDPAKRVPDQRI